MIEIDRIHLIMERLSRTSLNERILRKDLQVNLGVYSFIQSETNGLAKVQTPSRKKTHLVVGMSKNFFLFLPMIL